MQKNRSVCSKKDKFPSSVLYCNHGPLWERDRTKDPASQTDAKWKGFETLECFTDLKKLVQTEPGFRADAAEEGICVLLECMSNLTANELYLDTGAKDRTREAVLEGIRELEKRCRGLVAVTNEVFCDLPPADEEMQEYLSVLGTINCRMAKWQIR